MPATCPACDRPLRPGARFCTGCGEQIPPDHPLSAPTRRWAPTAALTAVAVVLVGGIALGAAALVGGSLPWSPVPGAVDDGPSGGTTILEPINSSTADSFMPPQGPDATPVGRPPNRGGGAVPGSAPGLFGGTRNDAGCDQDQIARFLRSHPAQAAAWAAGVGIRSGDVPAFLGQLTPVFLRADTYVTNHGYRNGELTSYPAVLQAGTAVLVDAYGTPRVKCHCGNPVGAPPNDRPVRFEGRSWDGFVPVTVIVIQPAPVQIEVLTVVDIRSTVVYRVPLPRWRYGQPPGWTTDSPTTTSTTAQPPTPPSPSGTGDSGTENPGGGPDNGPGTGTGGPDAASGTGDTGTGDDPGTDPGTGGTGTGGPDTGLGTGTGDDPGTDPGTGGTGTRGPGTASGTGGTGTGGPESDPDTGTSSSNVDAPSTGN